jgi:hypothetical protein
MMALRSMRRPIGSRAARRKEVAWAACTYRVLKRNVVRLAWRASDVLQGNTRGSVAERSRR